MTNEISHPYNLDESTFNSRGIGSYFSSFFHFSKKVVLANRIATDGMPHLGLFCLPLSHKRGCQAYMRVWMGGSANQ